MLAFIPHFALDNFFSKGYCGSYLDLLYVMFVAQRHVYSYNIWDEQCFLDQLRSMTLEMDWLCMWRKVGERTLPCGTFFSVV